MQQDQPQEAKTLVLLRVYIDRAQADLETLLRLQGLDPTDKRTARLQTVLANIGHLKTLRVRYMTASRYVGVYRAALDTCVWKGRAVGEIERVQLEAWIEGCKEALAEIEKEVGG